MNPDDIIRLAPGVQGMLIAPAVRSGGIEAVIRLNIS